MILLQDLIPISLPLLILLCIPTTSSLTCFCTDQYLCPDSKCVTDGQCRAFIKKRADNSIKHGYQCIDKDKLFPPERPFSCQNSKAVIHRYKHQCCDKVNFCNLNLTLQFETSKKSIGTGIEDLEFDNNKRTIYLIITVLASSVVILSTGLSVFYLLVLIPCLQDVLSTLSDSPELELAVMICRVVSRTQKWKPSHAMQCQLQHYRYSLVQLSHT